MPNFEKIPDMCVKMIRRVNDEDGIKVCVYIIPLPTAMDSLYRCFSQLSSANQGVSLSRD